ncbi:MAG TPA: T9SS type A sorting domain-containing protein, partial [Hymenobacter sp.]
LFFGQAQTTGTPPPSPYVALPYTESFEGTWTNGLSLRDLPTVNWRNTPAIYDNSWRREDDGFASAQWRYQGNETPGPGNPTPPYVTRSSTGAHSARFHSFGTIEGQNERGALDLYVNMSGAAAKTLSFDYINPTGADKLDVLVSTDGGATFASTPVLTATTSPTFANQTARINSSSATTVIRFLATSDAGNDDIGIDNLRLAVLTSTRNEALAATVGLHPNPAHRGFKLTVPAGNLHKASATLADALGKVVQKRQLSLPANGGTVDFDVSNLAPGVYSLQLQTAADLVVKRVVVE